MAKRSCSGLQTACRPAISAWWAKTKLSLNPFGSQAVASYIGSSAGISYVQAAIGDAFEMGCVPIPQEGPVKYISQWASNYVCLSKDEAHARGAYLFMKHFASEEVVVDWAIAFGAVPVFAEAPARENERFQEFVQTDAAIKALTEEIDYTGMLPSIPGAADVRTEIDKMVQNVSLGLSDADNGIRCLYHRQQQCACGGLTGRRPHRERPPGRTKRKDGRKWDGKQADKVCDVFGASHNWRRQYVHHSPEMTA